MGLLQKKGPETQLNLRQLELTFVLTDKNLCKILTIRFKHITSAESSYILVFYDKNTTILEPLVGSRVLYEFPLFSSLFHFHRLLSRIIRYSWV
ncbi:hypothetical protein LWI28_015653 [Acer negundo]|uniref:Uncharacterized protein n=1 Tax=Acer negundo TaxID=4023 RepID=A0AAD5P667_ACENE|nr:hypothetical protein LWI28_015653 [Acer negundo]